MRAHNRCHRLVSTTRVLSLFVSMDGSRRGSSAFKTSIVSRITAFSSRRTSTCRRSSSTSSPAAGIGSAGIGAFLLSISPSIPSLR